MHRCNVLIQSLSFTSKDEKECSNVKSDRNLIRKLEKSLDSKLFKDTKSGSNSINKTKNIIGRFDIHLNNKMKNYEIKNKMIFMEEKTYEENNSLSQDKKRIKEIWNRIFQIQ